ncbi:DUF6461 domain-containing protein, partial [Streptomyces sp. NPDC050610]|uniref:DUF6461 domain-containing protein n=1 Tax=Streptomyces sp. NPDC050610 TaxID=3157097 RepID=UPI003429D4E4
NRTPKLSLTPTETMPDQRKPNDHVRLRYSFSAGDLELGWTYEDLVCFNLVQGRTPEDVLRMYEADPAQARIMTGQQATHEFDRPPASGSVLRVGHAGAWTFCLESAWEPEGFDPDLLEHLSAGTDAIHYFRNPKGGVFINHLRVRKVVESFELALPEPLPQETAPWGLAEDFRRRASVAPKGNNGYDEMWVILSNLTGVPLNDDLVEGPLLTVLHRPPYA